jgi:DHA1 family multidrug resistance protein-like MFS transporter
LSEANHPRLAGRAFWLLFLVAMLTSSGLGLITPLLPVYQARLGLSGLWIGSLFAAFPLAQALTMPLGGKLSDKLGRRLLVNIGIITYALSFLLYLLDQNAWTFLIARVVNGLTSGLALTVAMAYIGDTAQAGREGRLMGNFNVSVFLGLGLGPFIGGVLGNAGNLALPYLASCGITLVLAIFCLTVLPPLPDIVRENKNKGQDDPMKLPLAKGLLVFRFVNAVGRAVLVSFLPLLALGFWGMGPAQIGIVVAVIIIAMSLLQIIGGVMADKGNRVLYLFLGSTVFAVMVGIVPFAGGMIGLLLMGLAMAMGGALAMPSATALIAYLGQRGRMGSAMGAFNSAMAFGLIIGPVLAGVAEDIGWAEHETVFWAAGIIGVTGSLIFLWLAGREKAAEARS